MSQLTVNTIQLGQSGTPANNFVLAMPSPQDGTIKLSRGNVGSTTQDVISVNAAGQVSFPATGSFGKLVSVASASYSTASSSSAIIPLDGTIPQNTEGIELFTVSITPTSASNLIYIYAIAPLCDHNAGGGAHTTILALFKNSDVNAISAGAGASVTANYVHNVSLYFSEVSGTTSAITYKVRWGPAGGVGYINRRNDGNSLGGSTAARIFVWEVSP